MSGRGAGSAAAPIAGRSTAPIAITIVTPALDRCRGLRWWLVMMRSASLRRGTTE
jgi:hypothetical protein